MKRCWNIFFLTVMLCAPLFAQDEDEESAALFLEDYVDEFQEQFFKALHFKSMGSYDLMIAPLQQSKAINPNESVIYFELGKAYDHLGKYSIAENELIQAVIMEPENYWYTAALGATLQHQKSDFSKLESRLPLLNNTLRYHIALWYTEQKNFRKALSLIEDATEERAKVLRGELLALLQADHLNVAKGPSSQAQPSVVALEKELVVLLENKNFKEVLVRANDALMRYPERPFLYYAAALAYLNTNAPKQAVPLLTMALEFVVDQVSLQQNIFSALSDAYEMMGNTSKAAEYRRKLN